MKIKLNKVKKSIAFAMLFIFAILNSSAQTIVAKEVNSSNVSEIIAYDFDITMQEFDKLDSERITLYSQATYDGEITIDKSQLIKEYGEYYIVLKDKSNEKISKEVKVKIVESIEGTVYDGKSIRAQSTAQTWINYGYRGVYGNHRPFGQMSVKYVDGKVAFCMEPDQQFNVGATYTVNNVSLDKERYINQIIYYGFHKTGGSVKNYAFTHLAVWNYLATNTINGTNFVITYGDTSNHSNWKSTVQSQLNNHTKRPSFNGKTYDIKVGEKIVISDTNNITNINNFSNSKVKKVSGGIEVGPFGVDEIGTLNITYSKYFSGYGKNPLIYKSGNSQDTIVAGDPQLIPGNLSIKVIALDSKIELTKTSAESGEVAPGAIFGLYKQSSTTSEFEPYINKNITHEIDEEIDLVLNDDNEAEVLNVKEDYLFPLEEHHYVSSKGKITLNNVPLGKYALKEIVSPEGHILNDEYIPFEVTGDGADINLDFPNEKIYGSNIIQKTDNRNKTYAGAVVNLMKWNKETETFDFVQKIVTKEYETITLEQWNTIDEKERGKLVDVVIDEEKKIVTIPGAAFVDELEYGKYGYEEIKAPDGTIIYKGVLEFYVTENGVVTTVKLVNLRELSKTGMINASLVLVVISILLMLFKKYSKVS